MGGSGRGGLGPGGGPGGCERRIEVFVKIKKNCGGVGGRGSGPGWGVKVDLNEELKFLRKFKKKIFFFFWGGRCRVRGGGGVRVDVNEELKLL